MIEEKNVKLSNIESLAYVTTLLFLDRRFICE